MLHSAQYICVNYIICVKQYLNLAHAPRSKYSYWFNSMSSSSSKKYQMVNQVSLPSYIHYHIEVVDDEGKIHRVYSSSMPFGDYFHLTLFCVC